MKYQDTVPSFYTCMYCGLSMLLMRDSDRGEPAKYTEQRGCARDRPHCSAFKTAQAYDSSLSAWLASTPSWPWQCALEVTVDRH